jgi:uncharacterized protein YdaU (DUF1376 family)
MSAGKPPAFMFYTGDFIRDQNVQVMDVAEVGAYIRLLCSAWDNGYIPADVKKIAMIACVEPGRMRKLWPAIEVCWQPMDGDETKLVQKRLERTRKDQKAYRERQAEIGRLGAERRWKSNGKPSGNDGGGIAEASSGDGGGIAEAMPDDSFHIQSSVFTTTQNLTVLSAQLEKTPENQAPPARELTPPTRDQGESLALGLTGPGGPITQPTASRLKTLKAKARDPKVIPSWVSPVHRAARALLDVKLADLGAGDRIDVARMFAYRHLNCTQNESKNRSQAMRLLSAFYDLGRSPVIGPLTVKEYFVGLKQLHDATGAMIRSPWAIKGILESVDSRRPVRAGGA